MAGRLFVPALAFLLTACATGPHSGHLGTAHMRRDTPASDIPLRWHALPEGKRVAAAEHKPLLVDFYAPEGCSRCDKMAAHVYGNPEIARYIEEGFVLVRIDLTANLTREEIALGRKYDYNYDCLLVFLDPGGNVIEDLSGRRMCFTDYIEPQAFIDYLSRAKARVAQK